MGGFSRTDIFLLFLLDFLSHLIKIRESVNGLFSVPAPLFDLFTGSSAGFFVFPSQLSWNLSCCRPKHFPSILIQREQLRRTPALSRCQVCPQ
jgi:hypothetical protein